MEDLVYKLNKYTIKLNKFINNNELIENNFDKYLLYLNKFNYYYYLTGGGKKKGEPKPQLNAEQKEGLATTDEANKTRAKRAEARAKEEREAKARTKEQSDSDNSDTKKTRSQRRAENRAKRREEEKRKHDAGNAEGKPSNAGEDGPTIQVINPEGNRSIATKSHSHSGLPRGNIPKDIMGHLRSICNSINEHESTA